MIKIQKKSKDEQAGITLITLILTVLLLIILSTIIIRNGIASYKNSKVVEFIAEMQAIQKKVDMIVENNEDYQTLGQTINQEDNKKIAILESAYNNKEIKEKYTAEKNNFYRYFDVNDILEAFNIANATGDIIVNFKTREIISKVGVEYDNKTYYTQYLLPGGQKLIEFTEEPRTITPINLVATYDGLNATITISDISITNATLTYKLNDGSWEIIDNYVKVGESYNIIVSTSGEYKIRLTDNVKDSNYIESTINIIVANKPKLEIDMELVDENYNYAGDSSTWAYATKNGLTYVWIPRFAYDESNNIKFLKGNTNIATDNTYIDSTWKVPKVFINDGVKITGVWKKLDKTDNADLIDLVG